jgi:hypothetical protein
LFQERVEWDANGTARRIRVTLNGDDTLRVLAFPCPLLLLLFASACANGGGDSSANGDDGGLDASMVGDGVANGDAKDAGKEAAPSNTSAQKACADDATSFCTQLHMCAQFLFDTQYGDEHTCESSRTAGCLDALAAPGTGWTGDKREACVQARAALDCATFLDGKPPPAACRISGQLATNQACLYGAQCGTGSCRIAGGSSCGTCATPALTGAPCAASSDCDGNLMCAGAGTCQPPVAASGTCDATNPCAQGLFCSQSQCTAPGGLGATCAAANNGADCDYEQGLTCDGASSSCKAYVVVQPGGACGSATPTVCAGQGTCYQSLCVPPAADGTACGQSGSNCMPPDTCGADGGPDGGTCALFSATQCK